MSRIQNSQLGSIAPDKVLDNVISVGDSGTDNYATLTEAITNVASGEKIIVKTNQTTSVQLDLTKAFPYEIYFHPNVKLTCSTALGSSVVLLGDDVKTENFYLELTHTSGTTTSGFEFNGNDSYHTNMKMVMNGSGGTVTNAYIINSSKKGNFGTGLAYEADGTVTNGVVDNSSNTTNDLNIRSRT